MITKHPWFGPKLIGWGWTPISWEGWLATALCAAIVILAGVVFQGSLMFVYVTIAAVSALLAICLLTGTRPG